VHPVRLIDFDAQLGEARFSFVHELLGVGDGGSTLRGEDSGKCKKKKGEEEEHFHIVSDLRAELFRRCFAQNVIS
jgi:hypothetical protein